LCFWVLVVLRVWFCLFMEPVVTGKNYDGIAEWWRERHGDSGYGVAQLERGISFVGKKGGLAIDVGCGSSGRFMGVLLEAGFKVEGMDVSGEMLRLGREVHPYCVYYEGDVGVWDFPKRYDFICAWDSTFHLPLEMQEPVLRKMCRALEPGGVLMFTFGGANSEQDQDVPGVVKGEFRGEEFEYSSLGEDENLRILLDEGVSCVHLEYDQGVGESHVYVIGVKR